MLLRGRSTCATSDLLPSIAAIRRLAISDTACFDGVLHGEFHEGQRFYCRFLLPAVAHVCPGDIVRAGVALMAAERTVVAYPYVFRRVCRNGAIRVQEAPGFRVRRLGSDASSDEIAQASSEIAHAIRMSAHPGAFEQFRTGFRSATELRAGHVLGALPRLLYQRGILREVVGRRILSEFDTAGDASLYGLVNAVTATARDMPDSALKWKISPVIACLPEAPCSGEARGE